MSAILSEETRERDKIARLARSLYERGLTAGEAATSAFASMKAGCSHQPTPAWATLTRRVSPNSTGTASCSPHDPPSKEAFLHRGMYDVRPQAGAIVDSVRF